MASQATLMAAVLGVPHSAGVVLAPALPPLLASAPALPLMLAVPPGFVVTLPEPPLLDVPAPAATAGLDVGQEPVGGVVLGPHATTARDARKASAKTRDRWPGMQLLNAARRALDHRSRSLFFPRK